MASTSTNMRGTNSAAQRRQQPVHGVVSVSSTTSEIDVATRMTMQPAPVRPWLREPDAMAEPGAERHDDVAGRDEAERGRQHDDAGEDRDEQPDALDEEASDRRGRAAQARASTAYSRDQHRDVAHEGGRDEQAEQGDAA